jgi:hypothetical protein
MLGVSFGLVKSILKDDLKMCQTATKFKPHLMSEDQNENCVNTFQDLQNLVPCEFSLFPKLKVVVNVWRYNDITTIQGESLDGLSKFQLTSQCFRQWCSCLMCGKKSKVGYFEVSNIDYDVSVVQSVNYLTMPCVMQFSWLISLKCILY